MKTLISRVSQTSSTSIFDLSSVTSLYTDSGPLAFPQAPHKIQLDSPASVLVAIQQKSYPFQRNRPPPPPAIADPTPQPATASPDVVDPIESSQQPTVINKHLPVISSLFSAALLPNMPDIRHLVHRTRFECCYGDNNRISCE